MVSAGKQSGRQVGSQGQAQKVTGAAPICPCLRHGGTQPPRGGFRDWVQPEGHMEKLAWGIGMWRLWAWDTAGERSMTVGREGCGTSRPGTGGYL